MPPPPSSPAGGLRPRTLLLTVSFRPAGQCDTRGRAHHGRPRVVSRGTSLAPVPMRRSPRREGTAAVLAAFVLAAPAGAIRISRGGDDSHGTSTMIPQPGAHPRMPWVAQLGEPSDVTSMPDVCRGRGECSAGACAGSFTCARTTPDPTAGETVCVDATGGLAQFCGSGAPDVACQPTRTRSVTRVVGQASPAMRAGGHTAPATPRSARTSWPSPRSARQRSERRRSTLSPGFSRRSGSCSRS